MRMSVLAGLILLSTAFIDPTPQSIGLGEIVYIGLFALMVFIFVSRMLIKTIRVPKSYLYAPLLSIFTIFIFSLWQAIIVNNVAPYLWLRGFIPFLNYLIIFLLAHEIRNLRVLHVLIGSLLLSALIILTKSIFTIINIQNFNLLMIRAILPNHIFQPHILASFGFLVGYASEASGKKRLVAIFLAFIFLIGIMITVTRSMTLIAILIGFFAMSRRACFPTLLLRWIVVGYFFLFLIWFVLSKNASKDLTWISRFIRDIRTDARVEETIAVLQEFVKHPLFGNGLGYQYSYYRSSINLRWQGGYTHNFITYILLTTGLTGLTAFVWLFVAITREVGLTYKVVRKNRHQEIRSVFWGLVFCLITTMLYSLFQSIFRALAFPIIVSFALVGIVALRGIALDDEAKGMR